MGKYLLLLRGINVGGRNKLPMPRLKQFLDELGYLEVQTYIQSGNAVLSSRQKAPTIAATVEKQLAARFDFDSDLIKALVLSRSELKAMVEDRPKGFGDQPDVYHSDGIFMMDIGVAEAMTAFSPMEGVDTIWPGKGIIYSQRLSAKRTKTRLNRMMAHPLYKSMTIRSWSTVTSLLDLL